MPMRTSSNPALYTFDAAKRAEHGNICGVDEAGRGPLCGPVCVAAVILNPDDPIEGVNDSKKLSEKRREALFDEIIARALCYQIVFISPQEIDELMDIMRGFKAEGKSILFITHKLNEIMAVSDRCSVLRKGRYIGTVDIKDTTKEELSKMMVGRDVQFAVDKKPCEVGKPILEVENLVVPSKA